MGTLLHFRDIYTEAFENCRPNFVVILLKGYSIFCVLMLTMAFYAFIYRVATGFEF